MTDVQTVSMSLWVYSKPNPLLCVVLKQNWQVCAFHKSGGNFEPCKNISSLTDCLKHFRVVYINACVDISLFYTLLNLYLISLAISNYQSTLKCL